MCRTLKLRPSNLWEMGGASQKRSTPFSDPSLDLFAIDHVLPFPQPSPTALRQPCFVAHKHHNNGIPLVVVHSLLICCNTPNHTILAEHSSRTASPSLQNHPLCQDRLHRDLSPPQHLHLVLVETGYGHGTFLRVWSHNS